MPRPMLDDPGSEGQQFGPFSNPRGSLPKLLLWTRSEHTAAVRALPGSAGEYYSRSSATNTRGLPMTDSDHHDEDVKILHGMGYSQELARRMGGFQNFAISFSIIC